LKVEGPYENDRNVCFKQLLVAIIRELYHPVDEAVIVGHHIVYEVIDKQYDAATNRTYEVQVVQERPSADEIIFNHDDMRKLFGEANYRDVLCKLALEPCETRMQVLSDLYYGRNAT
jgi:hypothetical protein